MKHEEKKKTAIQKLVERLYDPLQFRIFVAAVMLAIGYAGVYMPLDDRIAETTKDLKKAKEYQKLTEEVEDLQSQAVRACARLPKDTDTNEWVQYVLTGVRKLPVKMVSLDSAPAKKVGPFEAVVLQVELHGKYHGLESFLDWVETNERLFRIDSISVSAAKRGNLLEMKLMLLGLRG
jgi:Tfp pilus assembly protein PilO